MTDTAALERLIEAVEAGEWNSLANVAAIGDRDAHLAKSAFHGSLDAAKALHDALLPGWVWSIGSCHLSDDARVFPDFNSPEHGGRLRVELPFKVNGKEWPDLTDIDQRPAGNVSRAWLKSILTALLLVEKHNLGVHL